MCDSNRYATDGIDIANIIAIDVFVPHLGSIMAMSITRTR